MSEAHPKIDPEFKSIIPLPTSDELKSLEASILDEGCRDKLIVWNKILLDGHTRLGICKKHGIGYQVKEIEFSDRDAAKVWIFNNALGRRNLTPAAMSELRGGLYLLQKGNPQDNLVQNAPKCQNDTSGDAAEKIAQNHGVSAATVKRDGQFAESVKSLKQAIPELEGKSFPKGKVIKAGKALKAGDTDKAREILLGKPKPKPKPGQVDKLGQPVEGVIAEVFARAGEIQAMMTTLSNLKSVIKKARADEDGLFAALNFNKVVADLSNARESLKSIKPYGICPYCSGDGCKACSNRGWVGEFVYRHAPPEMKVAK